MGVVPKPVPREIVCSECGLPWDRHVLATGARTMSLAECVRLLKAELASRPAWTYTGGIGSVTYGPTTYGVINGGLSEAG